MSGNDNGMQDLGGGVSVFSPTKNEDAEEKRDQHLERAEAAFRKLSAEIAQITNDVGDPMTVQPIEEPQDRHLTFFLNNQQ